MILTYLENVQATTDDSLDNMGKTALRWLKLSKLPLEGSNPFHLKSLIFLFKEVGMQAKSIEIKCHLQLTPE